MKKRNKAISAILAACMLAGMLTGCAMFGAKSPEPAELMAGGIPDDKSISADISLTADLSMDMSDLGADASMNMSMDMDILMEQAGDVAHMDGSASISFFGMDMDMPVEVWQERSGRSVRAYEYDQESGAWTYSDSEADDGVVGLMPDVGKVDGLVLDETDRKASEWTVSGTFSADDLDIDMAQLDGIDGDFDMSVTARFDKKTGHMTYLLFEAGPAEIDGGKINVLKLEMSNIVFSDDVLEVPDDVKSGAVAAGDSGIDDLMPDEGEGAVNDTDDEGDGGATQAAPSGHPYSVGGGKFGTGHLGDMPLDAAGTTGFKAWVTDIGGTYMLLVMGVNQTDEPLQLDIGYDLYNGEVSYDDGETHMDIEPGCFSIDSFWLDTDKYEPTGIVAWGEVGDYPSEKEFGNDMSVDWTIDTDSGEVTGTANNETSEDAEWVKVCAAFFSGDDLVYYQDTYADCEVLAAGESAGFTMYLMDGIPAYDNAVFYVSASRK